MKPTLFVLAAGMGSRYGGIKQLTTGRQMCETHHGYSIFDAIRAGFGKNCILLSAKLLKRFS